MGTLKEAENVKHIYIMFSWTFCKISSFTITKEESMKFWVSDMWMKFSWFSSLNKKITRKNKSSDEGTLSCHIFFVLYSTNDIIKIINKYIELALVSNAFDCLE